MFNTKSSLATLLSLSVTALSGNTVLAQNTDSAQVGGLEEVVVTARKREESLQQVPLSVTALSATDIANRGLNSVDDLAALTPGLVFGKAFGRTSERPVMRGMGSILAAANATAESGVAYFIDGVYYPGDIQDLDYNDVARIEVIRGPQSALYGRNTYAGAINFITQTPGDELHARTSASFDADEQRISSTVSGRISESLAGTLTARYYKFDGSDSWVNQLTGKKVGFEKTNSVSGSFNFTPTDNIELRVRLQHNEDNDGSRPLFFQSGALNNCYPGTRSLGSYLNTTTANTNQWFCGEVKANKIYLNDGPVTLTPVPLVPGIPANFPTGAFLPATGAGLYDTRVGTPFSGVSRKLDLATFKLSYDIAGSGYVATIDGGKRRDKRRTGADSDHSQVNVIGNPVNGVQPIASFNSADLDIFNDWSTEVKLSSPQTDRFRWQMGAYHYEWERKGIQIDFLSLNGQDRPKAIYDVRNDSFFASLGYDFTDRIEGTFEWRKARELKTELDYGATATSTSAGITNNQGGPQFLIYNSRLRGSGKFVSATPRATLNYKVNPDLTLFAVYAKGFKPGGLNGYSAIAFGLNEYEFFKEETSVNYEVGIKSTWMDGRLRFNASIFNIKLEDIQLTSPVLLPPNSSGVVNTVSSLATNQGAGRARGVEIEAKFAATDNLILGLNYSLADTMYTKGCDDMQWTLTSGGGILRLINGVPDQTRNLNGLGDCSIAGKEFPLAAKHKISTTADYKQPVMGGSYNLYVNGTLSYESKKFVQVHNGAYFGEALLLGTRFGIENDNWSVGVYGRNLLNEDSAAGVTRWLHTMLSPAYGQALDPGLPSTAIAAYGSPRAFFGALRQDRQIGIEASYKF